MCVCDCLCECMGELTCGSFEYLKTEINVCLVPKSWLSSTYLQVRGVYNWQGYANG